MSDLDLSNPFDPDQFPSEPRKPASLPLRPLSNADEIASAPAPPPSASGAPAPAAATPPEPATGPVTWKAAASSVPKLRQQPASLPDPAADGEFPGFAQDALPARSASAIGEAWDEGAAPGGRHGTPTSPLAAALPLWEAGLERLRSVPRPVVIGVGGAVLVAAVVFSFLLPHGEASISLAKIRQHPEAFDGRVVNVRGRAGETFTVGGSYVFDLRQGRDTIVVYSHTQHPSLHERVSAKGTVSIGYLDGAPRLALFEQPETP